jgi:hypothetical protein
MFVSFLDNSHFLYIYIKNRKTPNYLKKIKRTYRDKKFDQSETLLTLVRCSLHC